MKKIILIFDDSIYFHKQKMKMTDMSLWGSKLIGTATFTYLDHINWLKFDGLICYVPFDWYHKTWSYDCSGILSWDRPVLLLEFFVKFKTAPVQ